MAKTDVLTPEQLAQSKVQISSQLQEANIRPFAFHLSSDIAGGGVEATAPYAISSAPGSDHETMDASLLMSPDYVQPLIPTELNALVNQVFSQDGASWLRHSAARKLLQWRRSDTPSRPQALYRPISSPVTEGHALGAELLPPARSGASTLALARIADHTQREERLAQIRLANWALELQRSLANERSRYETLAKGERAIWLTEKLNECVQEGTLVPCSERGRDPSRLGQRSEQRLGRRVRASSKKLQHHDPLGLLEVTAKLKARGWLALEVLSSVGVVGGLGYWAARQCWHLQAYQWLIEEWSKFWYGER